MKASPLYACAYVPEFRAQALLRLWPELKTQPVAVLEGAPPHERVCAGNARARRDGLRNGMTRMEAASIGGIAILCRSELEEEQAREAILHAVSHHTPMIEERRTDTAAMCVLEIAGMGRLYRDPETLAGRVRRSLLDCGLHASIAISANFHAACALAQSFGGLTVVLPGEERQALAPLLLDVLRHDALGSDVPGLDEAQMETLALWGIRTLGAMAALPEKDLIARMGQSGKHLRALALGEHPHLFVPVPVPWELREELAFDAPLNLLDALLFALSPMLDQLIAQARERALSIASVSVTCSLDGRSLDTEDDGRGLKIGADRPDVQLTLKHAELQKTTGSSRYRRVIRPTVPTQNKLLLLKLLELDLRAHPPSAAVLSVVLEAEAGKSGAVQEGLFAPPLPEASRLDVTVGRLKALVGEHRVGSPRLRDTHALDSFTMEAFRLEEYGEGLMPLHCRSNGGNHSGRGFSVKKSRTSPIPALRSNCGNALVCNSTPALRLLRPPEPLRVHTEAGHPVRFWFRGEFYQVRSACGPWRLSGAWWNAEAWACECWDVMAERRDTRDEMHAAPFLIATHASPLRISCRLQLSFRPALGQTAWCMEGFYD